LEKRTGSARRQVRLTAGNRQPATIRSMSESAAQRTQVRRPGLTTIA
jgi:hypothetical protein